MQPMYTFWRPTRPKSMFLSRRLFGFVVAIICSAVVLGIAAYFAAIFLPTYYRDFGVFSLVVPSLTIFILLLLLQWSQPRLEAIWLFIFAALWLAMGAWSSDIIGYVQCSQLSSDSTLPTKSGSVSYRSYCYEMKVLEAFSWMSFCLFTIFFLILITLTNRAQSMGRRVAWEAPIHELGWFGQMPSAGYGMYGYSNGNDYAQYPQQMYPPGSYVVQQNPGHSVVIQPGHGGQMPTISQVPGHVQSM